MKNRLIAGISAAFVAAAIFTGSAQASNSGEGYIAKTHVKHHKVHLASHVTHHGKRNRHIASRRPQASPAVRANVVAMIKRSAPRYDVPTWFALRIAKVESGYNPYVRGSAGEYGVFQLKCATARGVGFHGNCGQLLNASTNVQWGLKHLSLAVRMSHGNLKLAASKHNGGLGTKRLVRRYVAAVF
jgi:hypothetical protein